LRVTEVPTRLARDGRSRPPHLRTWRDGWRSLRFLLIYSPRWLFFYPGMLLGLVGASGLVWAVAAGGRPVWLVPLAIAILVGAQSSVFAAFSKIFAISEGLLPPDARTMRVLRYVTLEVGLAAACIVFVSGAALAVVALAATDGDTLLRLVLVSGTLIALGVQVGLSSFFLSILGLRRTGNPVG
jgi:hypothetical protein